MTSSCDLCNQQQKKSTPSVWCLECNQALCSSCNTHHSLSPELHDHNTVSFNDYQKLPNFIRNLSFKCKDHGKKYQYYCRHDDKPICKTCKETFHKICPDTPVIDDVIRNVKSSFVFEETNTNLTKIHKILLNAAEDRKETLTKLQTNRSHLLDEITEFLIDILHDKMRALVTTREFYVAVHLLDAEMKRILV